MSPIVAKFGGSSLATAQHVQNVQHIMQADPARRFLVPSAPGKRDKDDQKVTDMLLSCHTLARAGQDFSVTFAKIEARYEDILSAFSLSDTCLRVLSGIKARLPHEKTSDFALSRGEYVMGLLLSEVLGWPFLDAKDVVFFHEDQTLDADKTNNILQNVLSGLKNAVIPGFYGSLPDGRVHVLSRGGSDVTGALVARAVNASLYENWTDVDGFLMADPAIVQNPKRINTLTYQELRELSYMGASVLHEDAIFPVRQAGIPIHLRSSLLPEKLGTLILPTAEQPESPVTGIAGRKGFCTLSVEKALMNADRGIGRRFLSAIEALGLSFEHMPSGIDTLSVVLSEKELGDKLSTLERQVMDQIAPDTLTVQRQLALIAVVGRGLQETPDATSRVFAALHHAGIGLRMIDQGASRLSLIIGVPEPDFEAAIRALYRAFVE